MFEHHIVVHLVSSDKLSTETFGSDPKCEHGVFTGDAETEKTRSRSVGALWGFRGKQQCD